MSRGVRTVLLVVLVLVVAGAAVLLFLGRGRLDDARSEVDDTWAPLRDPLSARYLALGVASQALQDNGGGDRAVAGPLRRQLDRWSRLQEDDGSGVEEQVEVANQLEGTGQRLVAAVRASDRLRQVQDLAAAIAGYEQATISPEAVEAYNERVDEYQDARDNPLWGPSATVFGYDARPALVLASVPAPG
jgi:hypothetical protein